MPHNIDFETGVLTAFAECVQREAKPLAFSSPLAPDFAKHFLEKAKNTVEAFDVSLYVEESIVDTDFSKREDLQGLTVFILYKYDDDLKAYLDFKAQVDMWEQENRYDSRLRKLATADLCRLLGYSEKHIEAMLEE